MVLRAFSPIEFVRRYHLFKSLRDPVEHENRKWRRGQMTQQKKKKKRKSRKKETAFKVLLKMNCWKVS